MVAVMTFNGVDMSRFFKVIDIVRPIGNKRSVSTDDAPLLGVNIQQVRRGAKEHVVKFIMKTGTPEEMEDLKHELAGVLDVTEPVRIVYGDEPDKYYLGMPIDDVTPSNVTRWFQRSELKLLIPDGVAHSITYKRVEEVTSSNEKMVFELDNKGTVPAYPIITVNHRSENGYVGIVTQSSAFEVGNRNPPPPPPSTEVGSNQPTTQTITQALLDYRDSNISTGFSRGAKNVAVVDSRTQLSGTLTAGNAGGKSHVRMSNRGTTTGGRDGAASLTWDIPQQASSGNEKPVEYLWWKQIFQIGAVFETGFMRVFVTDTAGQYLYGVETSKSVMGYDCTYKLMVADGKGGSKMVKLWSFYGTFQTDKNPFAQSKGQAEIQRVDDKIQVHWLGAAPSLTIPELKGKVAAKLHVVFGAYNTNPLVSKIYLEGLLYQKTVTKTVATQQATPTPAVVRNRFVTGSSLVINSETDMIWIDGLAKNSEIVDGSQWPVIPPGKSTMELYVSNFVQEKPTVTIEFEERWL